MGKNNKFVIELIRNCLFTLFIAVLVCIAGSCTKDDSDYNSRYEFISTSSGPIKVRKDTLINLKVDSVIPDIPSGLDSYVQKETLYRYVDTMAARYWYKVRLGDWCKKYGLSTDSIYIAKKIMYSNYIPRTRTRHIFAFPYVPSKEHHMGFLYIAPEDKHLQGKNIIGYTGGVEIETIDGITGNCWTIIYYIGYDQRGNKIDIYYPCSPYDLEWHYYLRK